MTAQRIGKLRNSGKGIEGNIRIDGKMHRITVIPNPRKQGTDDADMFVLLIPQGLPRDNQMLKSYETK